MGKIRVPIDIDYKRNSLSLGGECCKPWQRAKMKPHPVTHVIHVMLGDESILLVSHKKIIK